MLTEIDICLQVEIIEETIRYIDALHHQLAIRMDQQQHQMEERSDDGPGGDAEITPTPVIQCNYMACCWC